MTSALFILFLWVPSTWAAGWADERCSIANGTEPQSMGLSMSAGGAANPKLACCIYGWNEPAAIGSRKKDCIQTASFATFEELYNAPGSANPTLGDSLKLPNRVFITDSVTLKPIPGFYTPDGLRCGYTTPKTIKQQFELLDAAAKNRTVPTADVSATCTRLVRVAMVATCPPLSKTNLVAQQTIGGDPYTYTRCTAAMNIKFHIGITDLSPVSAGRVSYHIVTSYDPAAGAGKTLDYLKTPSIPFSKILQITSPGSCMGSTDLTYDAATSKCRMN